MTENKYQARLEVAKKIRARLLDWEQPITHENVRRWFDMVYHQLPDEKVIKAIYHILVAEEDKIA